MEKMKYCPECRHQMPILSYICEKCGLDCRQLITQTITTKNEKIFTIYKYPNGETAFIKPFEKGE